MIDVGTVAMVPIELVVIGERARQVMGDLDGFEENLKEKGLISPLAMRGNEDGTYTLLAGERRFTILKRNGNDKIPARIYPSNLDELDMKIIEKSENFFRKDMEFYEFDALTLEIHTLQQQRLGVATPGSGAGWSVAQTGEMVGLSQGPTSQAIARAQAREVYPELFAGCKTASDATKVLKKVSEVAIREAIAQKLESSSPETDIRRLADRFMVKSFFEGVKEIPDGIVNLVEIDPPYAIKLTEQKKKDGESQYVLDNYNEIGVAEYLDGSPDSTNPWRGIKQLFKDCYRVMAQHSWLICWFAPHPWFEQMYLAIREAGFGTTRMCGIWTKGGSGQSMNPTTKLANSYEMFFYAWKGKPALNKAGSSNVFSYPPVPPQQKSHPTERPIELMSELYDTFAFQGSRVLIPFLGSGNGLIAAHKLGLQGVGFELSKAYKDSFLVKAHSMLQK
jgi:DNA modification methylase/ParB-like chromosome segregation protein Spo0J